VVDTGSTDRTKEIALGFGAKVFDFAWVDSFSAARNECLKHATGDWIFWMDADDRIDAENHEKLRSLFAGLRDPLSRPIAQNGRVDVAGRAPSSPAPDACWLSATSSFTGACLPSTASVDAWVMICRCLPNPNSGTTTEVHHVRVFRNHPQIRWEFRVHEQILGSVRRMGGTPRFTDIVICHTGYQDAKLRQRKSQRDLRLLEMEYTEQPDHPFTLFNLGSSYLELQRAAEALPLLEMSLARSETGDSIVRKLHYLIVQCYRQMKEPAKALDACQRGRTHYANDAELLAQEAILRGEQNDFAGAEACYRQLLVHRETDHFASVPVGLNGYLTRHNLAALYMKQGRPSEAEVQWRAAVAEQPEFLPSWYALEDFYLSQQRWADLEDAAEGLARTNGGAVQAIVSRARCHLARREFAEAKSLLAEAIAGDPTALRPRLLLSHVLLQENADPQAAEQALLNVLELDPEHAEAQRNLAILRERPHASTCI
jgi:tetratricopeptide (TPR) repeat protein